MGVGTSWKGLALDNNIIMSCLTKSVSMLQQVQLGYHTFRYAFDFDFPLTRPKSKENCASCVTEFLFSPHHPNVK